MTVLNALRRFLPDFLEQAPPLNEATHRAIWAIKHCRTAMMGGHLHACEGCRTREFHFHSCNHRSCPQCGAGDTAAWVERQLAKRVGAPYFMVTFTLPQELRPLFFSVHAAKAYQLFFRSASETLATVLANPKWLGAVNNGFITILHTWNQRLQFHPHIHCIVPGAGINAEGEVVIVKNQNFLVPQPAVRRVFRAKFRDALANAPELVTGIDIPASIWSKDWGVHLQPFGNGENVIKYLGRYVCRTAIGNSRIVSITDTHVSFRWKDRAHNDAIRTETITGVEFVRRYLRHVLPRGLRSIRYYGFCHPAAKLKRERIAFHTGRPLVVTDTEPEKKEPHSVTCRCCGEPMKKMFRLPALWKSYRAPPILSKTA